jgi:DNA-binding response OmpR family regulator
MSSEIKNTVLIVDDEPFGRDVLEGLLQKESYNLLFASSGQEALDITQKHIPDLILLDIMMPGMDGFQVCTQIRNNPKIGEIPILLITALDDKDSMIKGIDAGADDFISKPFDRNILKQRVKTILKLNRSRKLNEEREKFEQVIHHSDDGFLIINKTGNILFVNNKAKSLLDLPLEHNDYSSFSFFDKLKEQFKLLNEEQISNWADLSPEFPIMAVSYNLANYSEFWLKITILKKIISSEEYIIKLSDVSQEMVNNRDVWVFHNIISHKLRTPFNFILGGIELLKQNLTDLTENQENILNISLNGAQRYFENISNILDLIANINNKKLSGYTQINQFIPLIETVAKEMEIEKFGIKPNSLKNDVKLKLPTDIFELIMFKLLDNSKKFHPENNPSIEVKIDRIKNNVIVSFSDDGLQLSAEEHIKIWTPYYQAEEKMTGEIEGPGLGLSYIAQIMLKAEGTYKSYNNSGNGITVELNIPSLSER